MGHDDPGGVRQMTGYKPPETGGGYRSFAVENLAAGTARIHTPELVVTMWQGNWGHLKAMISADYEHIGVGFAETNDFSWYIIMVGWVGDGISPQDTDSQETPMAYSPYVHFEISEPDENGAIFHEVQLGQIAWTIAAKYGVDLAVLLDLNDLTENSILHPGDWLLIRPPDAPASVDTTQQSTELPDEIHTNQHFYPGQPNGKKHKPTQAAAPDDYAKTRGFTLVLITNLGIVLLVISLIVFRPQKQ